MSLQGIRVVDLTRIIAGPFCTQLLADLGADVVKVEAPGGDPMRVQGTMVGGISTYFACFNRNKRSIELNMRSAEGMAVLRDLIADADVVVENFKAGTMAKMGLSDTELEALNPRLTVCHISGFGATGPYSDRPAFDFVAQALSGFMSTNGFEGEEPLRTGLPISDLLAGMYGALAVSAALATPREAREFKSIDVSLTDSLVSMLAYMATETLATGQPMQRRGNDHPMVAPYGLYDTSDGQIALAPSNDVMFGRLLDVLERRDLMDDPRFATNAARVQNRDAVRAVFQAHFSTQTTDHWIEVLNGKGIPAGPVLSVAEALDDPQIRHREMVIDVPHPGHGDVKMLGFPIKQSVDGPKLRHPAPDVGAHAQAVLEELGYDAERIAALTASGAVPQRG
ncbi:CaiB/BaiF CoA transferase family protein [Marivita sp. S2033]|uniref:CaiB/BaiF CoA transferase family protein n=1 Tax=Marivita sp. S2033 TaxID=3373187 RepID=UPI0039826D77